ncbi:restriction endonuclease subunit S [Streptococcus suis]|uniref:restriction endonuclease subunit S n=1 Tax=Streptococcus suis TaxID=1307 RepID=UPI00209A6DEC|nr:restriction endonuclease subunit S [Streptococcus suis]MCO8211047.1 restriction endonuclease subunit S [Streptococcus suis]HEM3493526.1 restriction endonuclease subunit S [Streptococcus suis]
MPNKDRNIPKRRFKAFENADAWELRKLGNTDTIFTDGNYGEAYPKDSDLTTSSNGVPFLRGSNIQDGKLNLDNANYITISKHNELTSGHLEEDDIVIAVRGSLGSVGYVEEDNIGWNINSQLAIIRTNKDEITGWYLIQILLSDSGKKMINSLVTGTALKQLPIKNLKKIQFSIPTLPEQKAIATFFSTLDRQITLHQRKLDKLKHVKQAYLSEMFPAEGERMPKRRFPGFTDAWELRKLGEVADVFDGTHQTPRYTNQGVMFLSVEDINTLESEKYISSEDFEKEFKIFPEFNDVLMTRIGDIGTSNIVKTNDKIAYYVSLALIKPKKLESHFLNSIIQSKDFQNELWKRTLHIAFPKKINKGEISEVNLKFPTLPEQKTIGTFFSTLDRQITLHQRKLEKLKNLKKALLNELFV